MSDRDVAVGGGRSAIDAVGAPRREQDGEIRGIDLAVLVEIAPAAGVAPLGEQNGEIRGIQKLLGSDDVTAPPLTRLEFRSSGSTSG